MGTTESRREIFELCKLITPKYGFDPVLILAVIEQESFYDPSAMRLEQRFYSKYVKKMKLASTVSALFSTSWGLMQTMGLTLYELGYFERYKNYTGNPMIKGFTPDDFQYGIDKYMTLPEHQIEQGCAWLKRKQDLVPKSNIRTALRLYNGSIHYPPQVWERYERLQSSGFSA